MIGFKDALIQVEEALLYSLKVGLTSCDNENGIFGNSFLITSPICFSW